jgi:transposase-like protein
MPLSNRAVSRNVSRPSLGSTAMTKRSFSREFKLQVVRQLVSGEKRLAQLCREHNLCQTLLRRWREQYEQRGENAWGWTRTPAARWTWRPRPGSPPSKRPWAGRP